jgi:aminodeoxyfutalosine deaminase
LAEPQSVLIRLEAKAFADARGVLTGADCALIEVRPGAERRLRLLAIGPAREVDRHPGASAARRVARPQAVVMPGLVNAHTHLDLTHLGPLPHDPAEGFVAWVERIRAGRLTDEAEIEASVARGAELSRLGGVVAVGDIAGAPAGRCSLAPLRALRRSGLIGTSYLEYFGIGRGEERARERVEGAIATAGAVESGVRLGLQPHASNTIGIGLYRWSVEVAGRLGLPICTHLAETPEERQFVAEGAGPLREFLERLGLWEHRVLEDVGRGQSPVARLAPAIEAGLRTLVHVNDASDADIEILAGAGATVVYCPRAAAYFGAEGVLGPHRYREMLGAGVGVALGTDSIVNLPPEAAAEGGEGGAGISTWDEMKLLHTRDGTEPRLLLEMATVAGARAIGLEEDRFRFEAGGEPAGLVGVTVEGEAAGERETRRGASGHPDALAAALRGSGRPELLLNGKISGLAEIAAL